MDQETSIAFNDLRVFLRNNMVTKQDLQELRDELPTKADFNQLLTSVDGIAKRFKDAGEELQVGSERSSRMEGWIQKAAPKIGVEYKP